MMVRWAMNAKGDDSQLLAELRSLPSDRRKKDPRLQELVSRLKTEWQTGTSIERLSTLGWIDSESIELFSDILDNWAAIKTQYQAELALRGKPPPLRNEDIDRYEKTVKEVTSRK